MVNQWVIPPLVPEEVYTDRTELLDYFYNAALKAATRRTTSTVLLGQRRMGKTEIFKRVVNRLFFEQDHKNPKAVIPVYYCFSDKGMEAKAFAISYIENFLRYYVGFLTNQPQMIIGELSGNHLLERIASSRSLYPFSWTLDIALNWLDAINTDNNVTPEWSALKLPRRVSDVDDSTIVVFLDEFQNTRLPQYNFDIVGYLQEAVESPTCPHFVTGSAMSILSREIIGTGALYGRFRSKDIKPMTPYDAAELAMNASVYYKVKLNQLMAPIVAERCGGNPFYITAVIQQAADQQTSIDSEQVLDKLLAVDISSGFIWAELLLQVNQWINRINEHHITKWVLYLSALDEHANEAKRGELNIEQIQQELKTRENKDVSLDTIRDVLVKLSRGDLVEYMEFGRWFRKVDDPILVEFLKVWGKIEVEGQPKKDVQHELILKYQKMERRIREYRGYLAEIFMSQILWKSQRKTLPGKFFHHDEDIQMPDMFVYIEHRCRLSSGKGREIDLLGAAGTEQWVCQSKWIVGKKIGIEVLEDLLMQAQWIKEERNPDILRMWLFAHDGLTKDAKAFAKKHGILWSSRKEFDELLQYIGLRKLPEKIEEVA